MSEDITRFMCTGHLKNANVIPLWNPSSNLRTGRRRRLRRIDVGDVGVINTHGGFDVAFNILLDGNTNISCGYELLPPNFSKLATSKEPKNDTWDDNESINVEACGDIAHGNILPVGGQPYLSGFTQTDKEKDVTQTDKEK